MDQLVEEGTTQLMNSEKSGPDESRDGSVQDVMELDEDLNEEEFFKSSNEQPEFLTSFQALSVPRTRSEPASVTAGTSA